MELISIHAGQEEPDFIHLIALLLLHLLQQPVAQKLLNMAIKAISSKSGSADFLEEAGANINHDRSMLDTIFSEIGFVFYLLHYITKQ